ncbi:MAG: glutathione S-transferase N-terminal domain-containing protein [Neisseria sp.]|uniref:glutathione S-transferase family protein n=1 Tax=Neisseria sp. TaxID=192066 RepID=UPI0026DA8935|nr:glutathione binding-like protein [Neisseria sp.]MDO4640735.1 glutathione S-transferase N-terminal domain-containing protein [Neisseria sp.]
MLNLYYLPGACSLVPHTALEWSGADYQAVEVPRDKLKSPEFLALNPMGSVPVLQEGDWSLSQNIAILAYLNDLYPQAGILGSDDKQKRAKVYQWLGFINADLHPSFSPLFAPQRFVDGEEEQAKLRAVAAGKVTTLYAYPHEVLAQQDFLTGEKTIADVYLYVTLRWAGALGLDLSAYPAFAGFYERMEADEGVRQALAKQGLL